MNLKVLILGVVCFFGTAIQGETIEAVDVLFLHQLTSLDEDPLPNFEKDLAALKKLKSVNNNDAADAAANFEFLKTFCQKNDVSFYTGVEYFSKIQKGLGGQYWGDDTRAVFEALVKKTGPDIFFKDLLDAFIILMPFEKNQYAEMLLEIDLIVQIGVPKKIGVVQSANLLGEIYKLLGSDSEYSTEDVMSIYKVIVQEMDSFKKEDLLSSFTTLIKFQEGRTGASRALIDFNLVCLGGRKVEDIKRATTDFMRIAAEFDNNRYAIENIRKTFRTMYGI